MKGYIARRFLYMLLLLLMGSMVSFAIITLPPGDYMSYYVDRMTMAGVAVSEEDLAGMRRYYGLDDPLVNVHNIAGWGTLRAWMR
jgi:peptide/nickel transport system permease protein